VTPPSDEPEFLTYDEAVALLPGGERIHTFMQAGPVVIGADWDRAKILELLREAGPEIEVTGPSAQSMGHGLAAYRADGEPVFIETRKAS
jgi:hypothetical protein